ncbi:Retrotransposon-like protein [Zea mays]|uniref:Retrotransposon-like protein n=1 Tax=Zea mays TaxID=4577 RepID=A0A1D6IH89_MAIZE|nr:Retrotransposon-like protein [Zea mays]ONM58867.1 Retrotransposon-like protein [Zea mays]ONM58869.1 Retrotransposon-like protein [Zea mays]ONM58871.1 Retrotransposon-like protein [Zea mays]ONM58873.1 Retrotransposon-like protein [Zea mays]
MPNKPLSALTLQDRNAEVQIQIHRKWEFRGAVDNGPILHIDMILTDCTGNAIHCQIPSFLAATRGDEFQVGKIYKMTRFSVARAKSTYKPVDGDLMLYVTPYTTLELCHTSQSCFPLYVYHLTSYDKIDPDGSNARNFHDVLGIITEISAIKPVENAHIPSSYNRHVLIKNLSDTF